MNILGTAIVGAALFKILREIIPSKDFDGISNERIFTDYLVEETDQEYRTLKGMMTRRINKIVSQGGINLESLFCSRHRNLGNFSFFRTQIFFTQLYVYFVSASF